MIILLGLAQCLAYGEPGSDSRPDHLAEVQWIDDALASTDIPEFRGDLDDSYTITWEFPPDGQLFDTVGLGRALMGHTVIFWGSSHIVIPLRPGALLLVSGLCLVLLVSGAVVPRQKTANGPTQRKE